MSREFPWKRKKEQQEAITVTPETSTSNEYDNEPIILEAEQIVFGKFQKWVADAKLDREAEIINSPSVELSIPEKTLLLHYGDKAIRDTYVGALDVPEVRQGE